MSDDKDRKEPGEKPTSAQARKPGNSKPEPPPVRVIIEGGKPR